MSRPCFTVDQVRRALAALSTALQPVGLTIPTASIVVEGLEGDPNDPVTVDFDIEGPQAAIRLAVYVSPEAAIVGDPLVEIAQAADGTHARLFEALLRPVLESIAAEDARTACVPAPGFLPREQAVAAC